LVTRKTIPNMEKKPLGSPLTPTNEGMPSEEEWILPKYVPVSK